MLFITIQTAMQHTYHFIIEEQPREEMKEILQRIKAEHRDMTDSEMDRFERLSWMADILEHRHAFELVDDLARKAEKVLSA